MPLAKGSSRATIASNISEMEASGHPHNVAVAAALHTAHPGGGKVRRSSQAARKLAAYQVSRRASAPAAARTVAAMKSGNVAKTKRRPK
jgi:hypothetical protein